MSGAGLIEMLAARLGGRGMRRSAPALREVLASAMPNRAPVTAYEPIASRIDDPMAEGAMLAGADDMAPPMPNAARTGPDAGPVRGENEPIRVYHGTTQLRGNSIRRGGFRAGPDGYVWFSGDEALAGRHAGNQSRASRTGQPPEVLAADIQGANLKRVDAGGRDIDTLEFTENLEPEFDGVMILNAIDNGMGEPATIIGLRPQGAYRARVTRTAPDGGPVQAGRTPLGRGRSKTVYDDPADPARVIVEMPPDPVTEAFLQFSRDAHARGLPFARHLPNPDAVESVGNVVRYRTERLAPNDTRARVGRENGGFFITGVDNAEQSGSIIAAMNALDDHLRRTLPPNTPRHFYDLGPQNFMRRADGTLVINDPVESTGFAPRTGPNAGSDRNALQRALRERMERE